MIHLGPLLSAQELVLLFGLPWQSLEFSIGTTIVRVILRIRCDFIVRFVCVRSHFEILVQPFSDCARANGPRVWL